MRGKSSLAESHEFICQVGSLDEIVHAPHAGVSEIEDSECARNQTNANVGTAIPFSGMEIGAAGAGIHPVLLDPFGDWPAVDCAIAPNLGTIVDRIARARA